MPERLPQDDFYNQLITSTDDETEFEETDEVVQMTDHSGHNEGFIAVIDDEDMEEESKEKQGFFKSILPQKEDPTLEKVRKIIFMVAFVVFIATTIIIASYFISGVTQNNIIEKAAEVWQNPELSNH